MPRAKRMPGQALASLVFAAALSSLDSDNVNSALPPPTAVDELVRESMFYLRVICYWVCPLTSLGMRDS